MPQFSGLQKRQLDFAVVGDDDFFDKFEKVIFQLDRDGKPVALGKFAGVIHQPFTKIITLLDDFKFLGHNAPRRMKF